MIYEVKLKETMGLVIQELIKAAAIENQLTGTVKLANEEKQTRTTASTDDVKLMSNPPHGKPAAPKPACGRQLRPRAARCDPAGRALAGCGPRVREDQSAEAARPGTAATLRYAPRPASTACIAELIARGRRALFETAGRRSRCGRQLV